jgi:predicted glycoside hydrolase/deacetylase ChbG (UPF0249 family)
VIPVALCADDYSLSPGVDEGILALAGARRITAFSCMTTSPRWTQSASQIKPLFGSVDIGIHVTLTQLAPLGTLPKLAPTGKFPAMNRLYGQAMLRALDLEEISQEVGRQLRAFTEATGREPDFLDGHHHAHQLPGVRDVIARLWARRGWIRNTATSPVRIWKRGVAIPRASVLAIYGAGARRTWRAAGVATNADFAGVRNFDEPGSYRPLMQRYLQDAQSGLLIMCHPGRADAQLAKIDHVTGAREQELAYLRSDDFSADLEAAGCELVRLSRWPGR